MTNIKYVRLLKQNIPTWNAWRKEHPEIQSDLAGAALAGVNLSGADLSDAHLTAAELAGANLSHANLCGACLIQADLTGANLNDADLTEAILMQTVLAQIDLRSTHGLAQIRHRGPCIVELQSIRLPDDGSALHFLHSVGLPGEQINVYRASRIQRQRF